MRIDQLEHAIRAACDVAGDKELFVFGSQAILGSWPEAPASLRTSIEVDVQPRNRPEMTDFIDGALGQESMFHQTHGFYVHGVLLEAATLPSGWFERVIPVSHPLRTRGNVGYCLDAHDLAASKLAAFREKDRVFVVTMLGEGLIDGDTLLSRIRVLPVSGETRDRLCDWVCTTVKELEGSERDDDAARSSSDR